MTNPRESALARLADYIRSYRTLSLADHEAGTVPNKVLSAWADELSAPPSVTAGEVSEALIDAVLVSSTRYGDMTVEDILTRPGDVGREWKRSHVREILTAALAAAPKADTLPATAIECHKSDTPERVCFYEQDFYVLSNFSAFSLQWKGRRFDTSEAAYHSEKFPHDPALQELIRRAPSAHESFKIAERHKAERLTDWDSRKAGVMLEILRAKVQQHEYVRRKLLATGDRELVEDSWRDDYWGWGPNHDGQNMLGKLWMQVRADMPPEIDLVTLPASGGGADARIEAVANAYSAAAMAEGFDPPMDDDAIDRHERWMRAALEAAGISGDVPEAVKDAQTQLVYDLDDCHQQMRAVWNFLKLNASNGMRWSDEIIIAIEDREQPATPAPTAMTAVEPAAPVAYGDAVERLVRVVEDILNAHRNLPARPLWFDKLRDRYAHVCSAYDASKGAAQKGETK